MDLTLYGKDVEYIYQQLRSLWVYPSEQCTSPSHFLPVALYMHTYTLSLSLNYTQPISMAAGLVQLQVSPYLSIVAEILCIAIVRRFAGSEVLEELC